MLNKSTENRFYQNIFEKTNSKKKYCKCLKEFFPNEAILKLKENNLIDLKEFNEYKNKSIQRMKIYCNGFCMNCLKSFINDNGEIIDINVNSNSKKINYYKFNANNDINNNNNDNNVNDKNVIMNDINDNNVIMKNVNDNNIIMKDVNDNSDDNNNKNKDNNNNNKGINSLAYKQLIKKIANQLKAKRHPSQNNDNNNENNDTNKGINSLAYKQLIKKIANQLKAKRHLPQNNVNNNENNNNNNNNNNKGINSLAYQQLIKKIANQLKVKRHPPQNKIFILNKQPQINSIFKAECIKSSKSKKIDYISPQYSKEKLITEYYSLKKNILLKDKNKNNKNDIYINNDLAIIENKIDNNNFVEYFEKFLEKNLISISNNNLIGLGLNCRDYFCNEKFWEILLTYLIKKNHIDLNNYLFLFKNTLLNFVIKKKIMKN
jgi:acyl carrier protein